MDAPRLITRLVSLATAALVLGFVGYTSVHVVQPNEAGVIVGFGAVTSVVPPGVQLTLPWPMGRLIRVNTSAVDRISVGFRIVERDMGLAPTDDTVQWLTADTNIVEIQAVVSYSIGDPEKFLFHISDAGEPAWVRDNESPLSNVRIYEPQRTVVRRAAEAVITRRVANMKIDELFTEGKVELQVAAVGEIQSMLDVMESGLRVSALQIQSVNPPRIVIETFNDVQSARADRERRISEAEGYVLDTLPKARGEANAVMEGAETYRTESIARAMGVNASFEKAREEAARSRGVVMQRLWGDTMRRILAKVRIITVPSGDAQQTRIIIDTSR